MYYIYIVRCADGSHYTGITTDPARRMREHVLRLKRCAKYTKSHPVVALDALWSAGTRSDASKLESRIKQLPPAQKRALIAQPQRLSSLLSENIDASSYHPEPVFSLAPLLAQNTQSSL